METMPTTPADSDARTATVRDSMMLPSRGVTGGLLGWSGYEVMMVQILKVVSLRRTISLKIERNKYAMAYLSHKEISRCSTYFAPSCFSLSSVWRKASCAYAVDTSLAPTYQNN
eukprot:scaffold21212_cov78-Skeletonema_dohrnii-CCMP3373.AAC.1